MQVVAGLPTGFVAAAMQLADRHLGWRTSLRVVTLCLVALSAVCAACLREPPSRRVAPAQAAAGAKAAAQAEAATEMEAPPPIQDDDEEASVSAHACAATATEEQKSAPHHASSRPPNVVVPEPPSSLASPVSVTSTAEAAAGREVEASRRPCWSRSTYTLCVLYGSTFIATCISGGIDIFTVVIARGGRSDGEPSYDVASYVFLPMGLTLSVVCLISGSLHDRGVPLQCLIALALALHAAAAIASAGLASPLGGLLYAITRGVASGLIAPVIGLAIPHYFGTRKLGKRLGGQALFYVVGTCVGSMCVGASPSIFGEGRFAPMLVLMAMPAAVLSLLTLTLRRSAAMVD